MNKLNKLILEKKLKKYFKIINFINNESYTILKNLDLTLSLTKDFEGFGYSIAKQMYVETPVIATSVGGVKEYLNNKVANIIKSGDRESVTKLLRDFLSNENSWKKK